jgi:hypothetical protein
MVCQHATCTGTCKFCQWWIISLRRKAHCCRCGFFFARLSLTGHIAAPPPVRAGVLLHASVRHVRAKEGGKP